VDGSVCSGMTCKIETERRVLVVEDDAPSMRVVSDALRFHGYVVIEATDAEEAVRLAKTEMPGLVLMDIMLGEQDGYTACSRIKSRPETSGIPVLMLTALGFDLNKKLARDVGADGYIVKPIAIDTLADTVAACFE